MMLVEIRMRMKPSPWPPFHKHADLNRQGKIVTLIKPVFYGTAYLVVAVTEVPVRREEMHFGTRPVRQQRVCQQFELHLLPCR
jgi:hypothetical protein